MPRPENPLDEGDGLVAGFAADLRRLREQAGRPSYRVLAKRAHYSAATLADAAAGRRLPTLAVTVAYVLACGGARAQWEAHWYTVATELAREKSASDARVDGPPPYMGLAAFQTNDAERFFGREQLIDEVMARMGQRRCLALVGASGCGKSSLLHAGVVPRFTSGPSVVFTPGSHPLETCAAQLAPLVGGSAHQVHEDLRDNPRALHRIVLQALANRPTGDEVLIAVDQFEEMFTHCHDQQERDRFVAALVTTAQATNSRARVVLGLRSDFYPHCADYAELFAVLNGAQVLVSAMNAEQLRRAITQPATAAGCTVETALLATLVAEAADQPGVLPLVSHALLQTWHRRRGNTLTLSGYQTTGEIRGALAQTADDIYTAFDPTQQRLARQLFLRLTALGESTEDTKRRITRDELDPATEPGYDTILTKLAAARLVTLDNDTIEITHEALIKAWPRLHGWLADDRDGLRTHRQLTEATNTWESLHRDHSTLYRGTRLATAREWITGHGGGEELNASERAFVDASIDAEVAERAAELRRRRRLRRLAAGLAMALLVVTGLAGVTLAQRRDADAARQTAISRQLAAEALGLKDTEPGTAMLLSVAAFRTAPTAEARGALLSMAAYQVYQGELTGHTGAISDVGFDGGTRLASVSNDQKVIVWDTRSGTRRATLTEHPTWLRAVSFSPDGHLLATGGDDANLVLWDADRGERVATLSGHTDRIRDIKFSPDGQSIATSSNDRTVILWDVRDRIPVHRLTGHHGVIQGVAFSPDGNMVATASGDHTIGLWDTATGARLATLTGHTASVDGIVFSPDGRTLASASTDYTVRLWDVANHTAVATLTGHTDQARALAFSPDGRTLASAGHDHTIILWDVASRTLRARLTGHTNNIYTLAFHPRMPLLASGEEQGRILLWNIDQAPLAGHTGTISATAYSPDGRTLATASTDHTVILWDADSRAPVATIRSRTGPANGVAFSHDGRFLAVSTGSPRHATGLVDGGVMLIDIANRAKPVELATLAGHTDEVRGVAFTPDDRMLATASNDQTVILWDIHRHAKLTVLPTNEPLSAVAISPDGHTLAVSTGNTHHVILWNLINRTKIATLTHKGLPREMAFSPDSRTIATVAADRTVTLWDVQRQEPTATFTHSDTLNSVAFSPDGRLLVTGGAENTVGLWDPATGTRLATLTGHTGPVKTVAFAPDGHKVSSADTRTITWTINEDQAIHDICSTIQRELTREEQHQFFPEAHHPRTCP